MKKPSAIMINFLPNLKRIVISLLVFLVVACGPSKTKKTNKPLYEVLTQQNDGGANFRFFEILTEDKEITMLKNDPHLKNKIKPGDINTCNYVILNMGEKPSTGYFIKVKSVEETKDKILILVEDIVPNQTEINETTYPYTIVKINSKKEIGIQ